MRAARGAQHSGIGGRTARVGAWHRARGHGTEPGRTARVGAWHRASDAFLRARLQLQLQQGLRQCLSRTKPCVWRLLQLQVQGRRPQGRRGQRELLCPAQHLLSASLPVLLLLLRRQHTRRWGRRRLTTLLLAGAWLAGAVCIVHAPQSTAGNGDTCVRAGQG